MNDPFDFEKEAKFTKKIYIFFFSLLQRDASKGWKQVVKQCTIHKTLQAPFPKIIITLHFIYSFRSKLETIWIGQKSPFHSISESRGGLSERYI